jgi:hypothetical protein
MYQVAGDATGGGGGAVSDRQRAWNAHGATGVQTITC